MLQGTRGPESTFEGIANGAFAVFVDEMFVGHGCPSLGGDTLTSKVVSRINVRPYNSNCTQVEQQGRPPLTDDFTVVSCNTTRTRWDAWWVFHFRSTWTFDLDAHARSALRRLNESTPSCSKRPNGSSLMLSNAWREREARNDHFDNSSKTSTARTPSQSESLSCS